MHGAADGTGAEAGSRGVLERWDGEWERAEDICMHMVGSLHGIAAANTVLYSNYTQYPIIKRKITHPCNVIAADHSLLFLQKKLRTTQENVLV